MGQSLAILGRGIENDLAELIWHWLSRPEGAAAAGRRPDIFDKLIALVAARKTDSAANLLRSYLAENPRCVKGRLAAAALCLEDNRLAEARTHLQSAYGHSPGNTMVLYALGHCCERQRDEAQAIAFYQDCVKLRKHLRMPAQRLAAIHFKNGRLEQAIRQYELMNSEYPDDIDALLTLANLYITAGQYKKAADTFSTAILIHPDNFRFDPYRMELEDSLRHETVDTVMTQFAELLGQQGESADLLVIQADLLSRLGCLSDALELYERVAILCPDSLEAGIKLASHYLRNGDEQNAAIQFNRAAQINEAIVEAYVGLATAQKLQGDTHESLVTLSLAAAVEANSPVLFAQTAVLQLHRLTCAEQPRRPDPTPEALLQAVIGAHQTQLAADSQNADLHYRYGKLLMHIGRFTDAVSVFRSALALNSTFERARTQLAICLYETDEPALAIEQLTDAGYPSRRDLDLHYEVALLYCNKVKFACSLLNLQQYMRDTLAGAEPAINISIVLQNLGLLDPAFITWQNLTDTVRHALTAC